MPISIMKTRGGNASPDQQILYTPEATFFKSYDSYIAKTTFEEGRRTVYLDQKYWNYSRTTSKYRNSFLGETTQETKDKIASGEYKLINLN